MATNLTLILTMFSAKVFKRYPCTQCKVSGIIFSDDSGSLKSKNIIEVIFLNGVQS